MAVITNFREEQYPATDEMQPILVYIPAGDEFKYLLAGLMRLPGVDANYQGNDEAQVEGLAEIWREAYELTAWEEGAPVPATYKSSEVTLWGTDAIPQGGSSAVVRATAAGMYHNFVVGPTTPSVNWKVRWDRFLAAGDWEFAFLWQRRTNNGIIDFYATPASGGTVVVINNLDMRGTAADNQRTTGTFTLTKSELYHLELEVVGTSSGANYNTSFTLMSMWRTAD